MLFVIGFDFGVFFRHEFHLCKILEHVQKKNDSFLSLSLDLSGNQTAGLRTCGWCSITEPPLQPSRPPPHPALVADVHGSISSSLLALSVVCSSLTPLKLFLGAESVIQW